MARYIGHASCVKTEVVGLDITNGRWIEGFAIDAVSEDEAYGLVMRFILAKYPRSEGYEDHAGSMTPDLGSCFDIRAAIREMEAAR